MGSGLRGSRRIAEVTIPYDFEKCEETGRIDNFAKAGKLMPGEFRGIFFDDSDVYKVIEGASYSLAVHPDPKLDAYLDKLIAKIAAAQEPDGYLYTARTLNPKNPPAGIGQGALDQRARKPRNVQPGPSAGSRRGPSPGYRQADAVGRGDPGGRLARSHVRAGWPARSSRSSGSGNGPGPAVSRNGQRALL